LFFFVCLFQNYHFAKTEAGVIFGSITASTGLLGSAFGGFLVDRINRRIHASSESTFGSSSSTPPSLIDSTIADSMQEIPATQVVESNVNNEDINTVEGAFQIFRREFAAHSVIWVCSCIAAPASMMGFMTTNANVFFPLLVIGEMASFMTIGPINSAIVW
jgi:hypothetical protein